MSGEPDAPLRVLIVDDQALMRAGFRALLDAEDGIEVVGEAADGREGLELARLHTPDIALVDVQMPVMTGIEATRAIAADPLLSGVHVVILTNYGLDEYVFDALRAGAKPASCSRTPNPPNCSTPSVSRPAATRCSRPPSPAD